MIDKKIDILRSILCTLLAFVAVMSHQIAEAQYYTWGSDPAGLKWRNIKTQDVRLIYPDTVDAVARRTLLYIEAAKSDISYGFKYPALKIPFVMHSENLESNGLVMWLPKRIEFLTAPAVDGYSMPWTKQLVAHEYRHAVQYNNLNRGVVRVLSYIFGEQGSTAGLLFLPLYVIEGDAVMCETQMSSFGRGLQPRFTMGYRAIGRDMLDRKNLDRWFCGSYRTYTPDHYELGYQAVSYAYTRYDNNVWSNVASFGVHRPYYVATVSTALKKYYDTNSARLVRSAFTDLFDYWDSLPERENSADIVVPIDTTNYTTYSHPTPYGINGSVLTLKSDYNRSSRFVINKEDGTEQRVAYTGAVSTRPSLGEKRVFWSEYRRSTLFEQRVNSKMCYMDVDRGKTRRVRKLRNTLYPTVIDEKSSRTAYVEYDPSGRYSIVEVEIKSGTRGRSKGFREMNRTLIEFPTEVHGLAWDNLTEELYFIATDNSGMWLGRRNRESKSGYTKLMDGACITLSDLTAKDGVLYFGSIESGYDELHSYDIASGVEQRISQSTYGSFDPSTPSKSGYIYGTTYDKYGYHLSRVSSDASFGEVKRERLPQNTVNPKRVNWNLINLDSVNYTPTDSISSHERHRAKKYNKAIKIFNIHSWMPLATNPFEFAEENRLYASFGATVMSQNLLSSAEAYASYGYNTVEGSLVSGGLKYDGLGVRFEGSATYGGNQIVYDPFQISTPYQQEYYSVSAMATIPLVFDCGYHTRTLSASTLWNYTNGLVVDLDNIEIDHDTNKITNVGTLGFNEGLQKMSFSVGYSDYVRSSMRDLMNPFAYTISMSYAISPSDSNFSDLLVTYGRLTTRGLFPHNSLSIAGCYQTSIGGYKINGINLLSFQSAALLPEGFSSSDIINNDYRALSLRYQVPLLYPEGGIGSILYFRRIRFSAGFDMARFLDYEKSNHQIYSYGGELIFDINTMRLPESATSAVKFSLYQTNYGDLSFQFGLSLPI